MDDLSPDSALPPAGSAQDNDAPRQLVVCIDGTSNRFGDQPTNVVRLYRSLSRDPRRVLAYYDQGVGTFGLKETLFEWQKFPSRIAGLAFGWGLKRNVEGAYRFPVFIRCGWTSSLRRAARSSVPMRWIIIRECRGSAEWILGKRWLHMLRSLEFLQ